MQVSFIIPVHNQLAHTRACLDSLRSSLPTDLTFEIIIVDDASTDETRSFLKELAPPHAVLRNEQNQGYAVSNNRAARIARGRFLALLNNDLVLQPGWLEPMLAAFGAVSRPGVVGNVQLHPATLRLDHAGIVFHQGGYPIHWRDRLEAVQAAGALVEMPAVTAACCVVDREWFCRRGGFDEGYRNGFEDVDLCLRAREDGFVNLVATASVVHHHVSQTAGRGAHEFRNASRFLARWGGRTAALEREWSLGAARRQAAEHARQFFAPFPRRLGFGPATLRRQHRAALIAEARANLAASRRIRVGIDLSRMVPGGGNGGIKPLVFSLLAEVARQRGPAFSFAVFAPAALRDELSAAVRADDYLIAPSEDGLDVHRRRADGWHATGRLPLGGDTAARAGIDVLYAPFGVSEFMRPGLPCISVVVDLLHRDLPAALPVEEVNYRESCFRRMAAEAAYFQCNTHHVLSRLVESYGIPRTRCFHVYNAVQNRLPEPDHDAAPPAGLPKGPYFFYPANFWPHKNHEALLTAYRLYATGAGSRAWPLVLTGQPDARMALLQEMAAGLGLAGRVHFPGHMPDGAFAGVWRHAGALVFPSLHEGFGIPLLEAMRFGVPIIATDSAVIGEVAGDAFLPVDARDPRTLAETLRKVAIREGLREDLINRGRARLSAFSLALEAGRLAHFLEAAARRQTP
jgi:GT2 family glycosyltransferase/glycosyltransferase involved in cell wall biosynthesis